jgi:hypothetical protein
MMGTIRSSETSVFAGATLHNIPEDGIRRCHRRENLKSRTLIILIFISWCTGTTLQRSWLSYCATSREVDDSIPEEVINCFDWPKAYNPAMALGFTQPQTKISIMNFPESKRRLTIQTDKLTAICEPIQNYCASELYLSTWILRNRKHRFENGDIYSVGSLRRTGTVIEICSF